MAKSAIKVARKLLKEEEDVLEELRVHELHDEPGYDEKFIQGLYAEFAAEFDRVEAELSKEYGPPSRTGQEDDDIIPLNGVFRFAVWQVGDKRLFAAAAHEDRAPVASISVPEAGIDAGLTGAPIILMLGTAQGVDAAPESSSVELKYDITSANAPRFAADIVKCAREISRADLDYSVQSLAKVDEIIEGFRKDGSNSDDILATLFGFGCYVGEVFVRHAGFKWREATEEEMESVAAPLVIEKADCLVNPIGKVLKRMEDGEENFLPDFYERASRLPEEAG
jgi:hypothetical protein